jgi:hypothetical protein
MQLTTDVRLSVESTGLLALGRDTFAKFWQKVAIFQGLSCFWH